ncbi:proline--tRNA ligase [Enterobacteriaceae endosymbiont of Donacia bicoloricornis]|uniref:proline--tRNA ligase n=1 Tax=Enterobacteriaceae endosymbiont of Donacia bicoloricornis TaxID=2675772 RepID=UPI0014491D06|nr:proline--tRNA ligase [Enterobacteriaceae endosymbiont of Donacia bicoloricornis]QJC37745.1 proline--tRNA ligase [Enterobacteriaceae endosymbiont of Donacia bicoloricornis]
MLTTKYLFFTSKNKILDYNMNSYSLMLKAGMIKKLSSGIYTWLPTGLRVINNFKKIIRYYMQDIGAIELLLPILHPSKIWKQSGRINDYGNELLKILDRKKHSFILGPTHEEVITYLIQSEIKSYKYLPIHLYQIQTKFRDEIRSRLGVIRAKEFLMKDSYSFHQNNSSLKETYNIVLKTYKKIFNIMKINFLIIKGDNNIIGGNISHEFHIFSENGENKIYLSKNKKLILNKELREYFICTKKYINKKKILNLKNCITYKKLAKICNSSIKNIIRTSILKTSDKKNPFIALLIRADYKLNFEKIKKINNKAIKILSEKEIEKFFNININSIGPFNLKIPIIGDYSIINMYNFIIGSNIRDKYLINTNWEIDLSIPNNIQNISNIIQNESILNKKNLIKIRRSIEIAHIFQIGKKYSKAMNAYFYDRNKIKKPIYMGCYGIGISRLIAAIIEQNHDNQGIYWPNSLLAPFLVAIIPINLNKDLVVKKYSFLLYKKFKLLGINILLDNRNLSPGIMFSDIDLIGVPHIIVINKNNILNKNVEYKYRKTGFKKIISTDLIVDFIFNKIKLNKCFNIFYSKK